MIILSGKHQTWLKAAHLFAACSWVGGVFSLLLLHALRYTRVQGDTELYGIDRAASIIDMGVVIISGACLCLLTGFIYSIFTGWGFLKHKWIIAKWILSLAGVLFGAFTLGPWEDNMLAISKTLGNAALENSDYLFYHFFNCFFVFLQFVMLLAIIWISATRPWRPTKQES